MTVSYAPNHAILPGIYMNTVDWLPWKRARGPCDFTIETAQCSGPWYTGPVQPFVWICILHLTSSTGVNTCATAKPEAAPEKKTCGRDMFSGSLVPVNTKVIWPKDENNTAASNAAPITGDDKPR